MSPSAGDALIETWRKEASRRGLPLPRLFIPGVPKSGTTSFARALGEHERIVLSRVKETHFFTQDLSRGKWRLDSDGSRFPWDVRLSLEEYSGMFEWGKAPGVSGLEASTDYFHYGRTVAERIDAIVGDRARVAVFVRNPVERAQSLFLHMRREVEGFPDFEDFLDLEDAWQKEGFDSFLRPVGGGLYYRLLEEWRAVLGSRMRVFVFEECVAAPDEALLQLAEFFEVGGVGPAMPVLRRLNEGGDPRRGVLWRHVVRPSPWKEAVKPFLPSAWRQAARQALAKRLMRRQKMAPGTRRRLVEVFREDVRATEDFLGRRLPWRDFEKK